MNPYDLNDVAKHKNDRQTINCLYGSPVPKNKEIDRKSIEQKIDQLQLTLDKILCKIEKNSIEIEKLKK